MDRPRHIGRFEVLDKIGQGGMGVLWLARDPRLERLVAIKQLWTHSDEVRRRFLREAAIAAKLQHPNIVTIYDTAEQDGQPFIAMEYIAGKTVAELIKTRTAGPTAERLRLMIDLCEGLAFAHRAGVIHRDIKPANLMLTEDGQLKILDFGIARVADASLTQDGATLGTPNYMSPEQVEGHGVDQRSDIFAVGLVLYELLSYRQAFPGDSHHMVALRILREEPEPLLNLMPGLAPELEPIVDRCLRKQPAERYADLVKMRRDLVAVRDEMVQSSTEETAVRLPVPRPTPGPKPTPAPRPTPGPTPDAARGPATPSTPGDRRFDKQTLRRKREELITRHLAAAERALSAGELPEAHEEVEAAATIEPEDSRVLAMLERVRVASALHEASDLAARAEELARSGALTEAMTRLAEAERVHPAPAELAALRRDIAARIEARERQRARRRAFEAALERAQKHHQAGSLEPALRALEDALQYEPDDADVRELRDTVERELDEHRRADAEAQQIAAAVEACDAALERDDVDAAVAALDACGPVHHDDLAAARARIHEKRTAIERKRRERERQEREAERQRIARDRWVAHQCRLASDALDAEDPDLALTMLDAVSALGIDRPEVREIRERALALQQDKRRREQAEQLASDADDALAADDPHRAAALLSHALELTPGDASLGERLEAARRAVAEVDARREAEARERAVKEAVRTARQEFARGHRAEALDRLRAIDPPDPMAVEELARLTAESERLDREARAAAERERKRLVEEAARRAVAEAQDAFDRGDDDAAERLRAYEPPHPLVTEATSRLAEAARLRRLEREEAERRRQLALLDERAARAAEAARRDFDQGRRTAALKALRAFDPPHAVVNAALQALEAEDSRLREEAAREAERMRLEREAQERARREAESAIASATATFETGRHEDAIAQLRAFAGEPALVAGAVADLVTRAEEHQREERRREAQSAIRQARAAFDGGDRGGAIAALRAFAGDPALVARALADMTAEAERLEQEQRDRERRAREEAERRRRARLQTAAARLREGELESAAEEVERVLAEWPDSAEAADLRRQVAAAVEERAARARALEEAQRAIADAERLFSDGHLDDAVEGLRRFGGDATLVARTLGELSEAAAWRRARATHLARAAESEAAGRLDDALDALRTLADGDRRTSRPPAGASDVSTALARVARARIQGRLGEAIALVAADRLDDAAAALVALERDIGAAGSAWSVDPETLAEERQQVRTQLASVRAERAARAEAERRRLEAEQARARRARERRELFDTVRIDFRSGQAARGVGRLGSAGADDPIVAAACARLGSGVRSTTGNGTPGTLLQTLQGTDAIGRAERLEAALQRAEAFLKEGRRSRAGACVEEALAADPRCAEALALREWLSTTEPGLPPWRDPRRAAIACWDAVVVSVRTMRRRRAS